MISSISAEPLVSVVTPFYNSADYLAECIESVLNQTHRNFEYILLDNCSTDGSQEIAQRYAARDARIKLFRNDALLPQVNNYNAALAKISADSAYTKVVEADNWIYPECLQRMVAVAHAHPRVGVVSSYNITERAVRFAGLHYGQSVYDGREIVRRQLKQNIYVIGAPTTVLMRSDAVRARRPFYDESAPIAEDQSACFEILRDHDFGFVHQILSFIRTDNVSILSGLRGLEARSLDVVLLLARHGHDFLDPLESTLIYREARRQHHRAVARRLLRGHGKRLLEFHRQGLALSQLRLSKRELAVALAIEGARALMNPRAFLAEWRAAQDLRRAQQNSRS